MTSSVLHNASRNRVSSAAVSVKDGSISAAKYLNLIQRDGILKTQKLSKIERGVTLRKNHKLITENDSVVQNRCEKNIDYSQLKLTFNESSIWLLPVNSQKIAVQWHIPTSMRRNCLDIFKGEEACFVLRIYQNTETLSGWKKSQRTLEFEIDINRNCCYINLENNTGIYTAELGLRCSRDRHIFIARSAEIRMPVPGSAATKKIDKPLRITQQNWSKKHPLKHRAEKKIITPENQCEWENRDVQAEENVAAIYNDFIDEGPRSLRIAEKITPASKEGRKASISERLIKVCISNADSCKKKVNKLINTLCSNRSIPEYVANKFQVMATATPDKKKKNNVVVPRIQEQEINTTIINSKLLQDKISKLKDKAEIILRGKVKRPGQRVRVGGLLIEPDDDGSFCVACVIRNGKLHVPVEEVCAICES